MERRSQKNCQMNMVRREIKWAAGGFVGGFLLCYFLMGTCQSPRPASPLLGQVTPAEPVPLVLAAQFTNLALPKLHHDSIPRRLGPGTASGLPHPYYSLDLIDTHAETPRVPESQ